MRLSRDGRPYGELAKEWDNLALLRSEQIWGGNDASYVETLVPLALELAEIQGGDRVLDAGCGVGYLTKSVRELTNEVIGIDISRASLAVAEERNPGVTFVHTSIEDFAARGRLPRFSVVVASMVLMDTPFLDSFLRAASRLLEPGGRLAATLTHPYFWPRYRGYEADPQFDYLAEIAVEGEFRISGDRAHGLVSTHFHRPLGRYVTALSTTGFTLRTMKEVRGPGSGDLYPRFLGLTATR